MKTARLRSIEECSRLGFRIEFNDSPYFDNVRIEHPDFKENPNAYINVHITENMFNKIYEVEYKMELSGGGKLLHDGSRKKRYLYSIKNGCSVYVEMLDFDFCCDFILEEDFSL